MGRPYLSDRAIRRDTIKVLKGIDSRYTMEAAEKLRTFDRPTLLAWAVEDRFFKLSYAERLADTIQGARLERIDDSYTFVSEDQPERLAELIEGSRGSGCRLVPKAGRPCTATSEGSAVQFPLQADRPAVERGRHRL